MANTTRIDAAAARRNALVNPTAPTTPLAASPLTGNQTFKVGTNLAGSVATLPNGTPYTLQGASQGSPTPSAPISPSPTIPSQPMQPTSRIGSNGSGLFSSTQASAQTPGGDTGYAQPQQPTATSATQSPAFLDTNGKPVGDWTAKNPDELMQALKQFSGDSYTSKQWIANYEKSQGANIDTSNMPSSWEDEANLFTQQQERAKSSLEQNVNSQKATLAEQNAGNQSAVKNQFAQSAEGVNSSTNPANISQASLTLGRQYDSSLRSLDDQLNQLDQLQKQQKDALIGGRLEDYARIQQQTDTAKQKLIELHNQAMAAEKDKAVAAKDYLGLLDKNGALGAVDQDTINYLKSSLPGAPPGLIDVLYKSAQAAYSNDQSKQKLDNTTKGVGMLTDMVKAGVPLNLQAMQAMAKSTGLPLDTIVSFNDQAQTIMQDKTLDLTKKQAEVDRIARGITSPELEKVDYISNLYKRGASQEEITQAKRIMGVKDEDDPMYNADLQIKQAQAQQEAIKAKYAGKEPPYGTKDYWDVQKLKADIGKANAESTKLQGGFPGYSGLGAIASKYEGSGPATVSSGIGDAGGKSYGSFQLSRGNIQSFLNDSGYADKFSGLKPTSPEFDQRWKEVAAEDPDFAKAQSDYIAKTHYDPMINNLSNKGFGALADKGPAVQEMIFSTAVQYGPNSGVIADALKGKDVANMSDKDIVSAVQDYKAKTVSGYFGSSSAAVRAGVANRIKNEKNDLVGLANGGTGALPDNLEALATKIANYDVMPNSLGQSKDKAAIIARAAEINPNYDQTDAAAKVALKKDWATGTTAQNVKSVNTLIGHLDELKKASDELGNHGMGLINMAGQAIDTGLGSGKTTKFNTAKAAVASELAKVLKGGGTLSEGEVHDWEKKFDSTSSPEQLSAAIDEATKLMGSRLREINDQYRRTLNTEPPKILSKEAKAILDKGDLGISSTDIEGADSVQQDNAAPSPLSNLITGISNKFNSPQPAQPYTLPGTQPAAPTKSTYTLPDA